MYNGTAQCISALMVLDGVIYSTNKSKDKSKTTDEASFNATFRSVIRKFCKLCNLSPLRFSLCCWYRNQQNSI